MSPSANITAIQALQDFSGALNRFKGEALEALNAAAQEIQRTFDWLTERLHYWQAEVRRREEILAQVRAELVRCRTAALATRILAAPMSLTAATTKRLTGGR